MLRFKRLMLCSAVATLLIIGIAFPAAAQRWDKKTTITTNVPVRVGNVILPAGKYVMRLHDDSTRRLVEIYNADETKLYTTTFGLPDFRMDTTDQTVMTFYEADAGRVPALRTWFYPVSQFGLEFIDSRGPVQQIASAPEPAPAQAEPAPAPPVEEVQAVNEEPAPEPAPANQVALNEPPPAPQPEPEPTAPAELPKTGGDLPLLLLTGLLSLGASFSLKRFI